MARSDLHITARPDPKYAPNGINYYFNGKWIGFSTYSNLLDKQFHFTPSIIEFCLEHGIEIPKK